MIISLNNKDMNIYGNVNVGNDCVGFIKNTKSINNTKWITIEDNDDNVIENNRKSDVQQQITGEEPFYDNEIVAPTMSNDSNASL